MSTDRWLTLDYVKTITLIGMIIVHNAVWWIFNHPQQMDAAVAHFGTIGHFLGFFVMLIPVTAGSALYFYFRQHRGGRLLDARRVLGRALLLIIVGYVMNAFAFGTAYLWQWNVLQFFSLSMLLVYVIVRYGQKWMLVVMGAIALIGAPLLREMLGMYDHIYPVAIAIGEPQGVHIWALFPWLSFIVLGFFIADWVRLLHEKVRVYTLLGLGVLITSVTTLLSGTFLLPFDFYNPWGATVFQPPTLQVLSIMGIGFLLFAVAECLERISFAWMNRVVHTMSVGLLYTYVVHMILGYQLNAWVLSHSTGGVWIFLFMAVQILMAYYIGRLVLRTKQASK